MMNKKPSVEDILFLDIETVPQYANHSEMPDKFKALWDKKTSGFREPGQFGEDVYQRAGIYAEFGKIICISIGMLANDGVNKVFRLKSFFGDDEKKILEEFAALLTKLSQKKEILLCGHNAKEFDFPFMLRRMIIHRVAIPEVLDMAGKKPWEVKHLDTMELWKFGDYKAYTSLELLTAVFDIPTPKEDIDGSQVAQVYYEENDLNRIVRYCERDVLALAQVYLRYRNDPMLDEANVSSATEYPD